MKSTLAIVAIFFLSAHVFAQEPPPISTLDILDANHTIVNVTNNQPIINNNETLANNSTGNETSSTSSPSSLVASESTSSSTNVTIAANADANVTALNEANITSNVANVVNADVANSTNLASTEASTTTTAQTVQTRRPQRPQGNVPGLPQLSIKDNVQSPFIAKGVYVKTSAGEKSCKENPDCYNLREPDEWCPLPERSRYSDKGCFCDHLRFVCTIQRQSPKGEDEYTDCGDKAISVCTGYKPIVHVQQQQPQVKQEQKPEQKQEQRPKTKN